jgi:hypothetical protein
MQTTGIVRDIARAIVSNRLAIAQRDAQGNPVWLYRITAKNLEIARSAVHDGALMRADRALCLAQVTTGSHSENEHDDMRNLCVSSARDALAQAMRKESPWPTKSREK